MTRILPPSQYSEGYTQGRINCLEAIRTGRQSLKRRMEEENIVDDGIYRYNIGYITGWNETLTIHQAKRFTPMDELKVKVKQALQASRGKS